MPPDCVIHRLTGDGPKNLLIAPLWSSNKKNVINTINKYFKDNIVYINVMKNMSVDCDCCAVAEDPCMDDIGILISTDPIAIDQACIDLVYASNDKGRNYNEYKYRSNYFV